MIDIDYDLTPADLLSAIRGMWRLSGEKVLSIERTCTPDVGTPVFTVNGKYTTQGWTEWTQGFQFGSSLLQFDATDEDVLVFHAGTDYDDKGYVINSGGRVLTVVSKGSDYSAARAKAYGNIGRITFEGCWYRKDIAMI